MGADRPRLAAALRRLRHRTGKGSVDRRELDRLTAQIDTAVERAERRRREVPKLIYPPDLPVSQRREEIIAAIREHQIVVVAGETGSGKTTQLPKICLEAGRGVNGWIGHTQPRRIAARSLADRIGEELKAPKAVGYKIRFADTTSLECYVKVMTDGVLLAETQSDRRLQAYDTLILDEAHERSLNIDFLIGYIKRLLSQRPDLKLIITSATIDTKRFSEHFDDAPVIEVSGRMYPVDVRYEPPEDFGDPPLETDLAAATINALDRLPRDGEDVLIFFPTERDILETAKRLRARVVGQSNTVIQPLYGRLPVSEQQKVFRLIPGKRRIVLASNVAETSLTVPGIRYVVDTGLARISRYAPRAQVQRLPVEPVSQAAANQRAGRCGRIGPGICIRLYNEEDFGKREAFTSPEITRSSLAGVVLRMAALKLGSIQRFPFLDPPRTAAVRDAERTLHELNALGEDGRLTRIGLQLSRLPVDPRIGRIILAGADEGVLPEVLIVASALEGQDPRIRPPDEAAKADQQHRQFVHETSDFLTLINLWDWYHQTKAAESRRGLERACAKTYVSYRRFQEWLELHRQLKDLAKQAALKLSARPDDPEQRRAREDPVHRALLAGLLSHVARRVDKADEKGSAREVRDPSRGDYEAGGGNRPALWPGSAIARAKPKWVVSSEQVQTSRLFLRTNATIQPQWILPLAEHVVTRRHSDEAWSADSGRAMCKQTIRLYGLPIVENERVPLDHFDLPAARQLFVHHALVLGESRLKGPWREHNESLIDEAAKLAHKLRRQDVLMDLDHRHNFYERRVPVGIVSCAAFEKWRKTAERDEPGVLRMTMRDAVNSAFGDPAAADLGKSYPDTFGIGGHTLPLTYIDDPTADDDGVTLQCPLTLLNQLNAARLAWMVPGLLPELIKALIRGLPKSLRQAIGPAPMATAMALEKLVPLDVTQTDFFAAAAEQLGHLAQCRIEPDTIQSIVHGRDLPRHLRMNLRIVEEANATKVLAEGRDLAALRRQLADRMTGSLARIESDRWRSEGMTEWTCEALPVMVDVPSDPTQSAGRRGSQNGSRNDNKAGTIRAYPALADAGASVSMSLWPTPEAARRSHAQGVRRLCYLNLRREITALLKNWSGNRELTLKLAPLGDPKILREHVGLLIAQRACLGDKGDGAAEVRDATLFDVVLTDGWNQLTALVPDTAQRVLAIADLHHRITLALDERLPADTAYAITDIRYQMSQLMPSNFLLQTPMAWLGQFPRYLTAIQRRLERLRGGAAKDIDAARRIIPRVRAYAEAAEHQRRDSTPNPALDQYRWLIEEYRVQLWAQDLGAALPVSEKKMDQAWAKVGAG